jgi:hypothetical protein
MSQATSTDQPEPVTQKLNTLSRGAHQNLDVDDPVDYWYRLGQRNAYAQAAGLVARGTDSLAFTIPHMTAQRFAALVAEHQVAATPESRGVGMGVEP